MKKLWMICGLFSLSLFVVAQELTTFNFSVTDRGPVIGPMHYGIFFEEINHAGEGGLYAELIRNGSLEENGEALDYWQPVGNAKLSLTKINLLNGAQQRAMSLNLKQVGDGARNEGFWGINIVKGQRYQASFWIRTKRGWEGDIALVLETDTETDLGHTTVHIAEAENWTKYSVEIIATGNDPQGMFALRLAGGIDPSATVTASTIYLDCISLFPPTFKNRSNGMRIDLAEKLAALHPRFMRFPGGCYVEGGFRFQWKHSVGPVEERMGIYNSHWGYPVSNGMGFHEFLQLAEDLGAEPLFVVNVGIGHGWYKDYQNMEDYIQEALDALEYANGSTSTYWGKKRADMGHPGSFNLRLIEIGNENYNFSMDNNNDQSDHYPERYKQIRDAIKARYPDVVCIGNVESWGTDNPSWRNPYEVEMVDEHYYRDPDWFAANYHKYDDFNRMSYKVYNGEYAVALTDSKYYNTLQAALGEAIYMAGMERNSDVCVMASYAPIFQNENAVQWDPDMIHFNASESYGTPSYWVQQMMASHVGHQNLTWTNTQDVTGNARLGLGSWDTDVTYKNIKVTAADGTVTYSSDKAITSPASTKGNAHILDVSTENCTVELDAVKNSGNEGFLITFAYVDSQNYAWWNLGGWGNDHHGVELCLKGEKTTLGTASGSIETGRTYHIKIVRKGLQAQCYLDGTLLQTVTLVPEMYQSSTLHLCASLGEAEDSAIVKIINYEHDTKPTLLQFEGMKVNGTSQLIILSHNDNSAKNSMENPMNVAPEQKTLETINGQLIYDVPPYSLTVLTIPLSAENVEAENLIAQSMDGKEVDLTSLLTNADFAQGTAGWKGTSPSAAPGTVAEHFNQLFDTYQELHNMPAGQYRLEWQGFYRNGDISNAYQRHKNGTEATAEVYANQTTQPMLSLYDKSVPYTFQPYNYPDNVYSADEAFKAGHYQQQLTFTLPTKTDLRIGLRKFTPCVNDWACFDNFHLIYVGATGNEPITKPFDGDVDGDGQFTIEDITVLIKMYLERP